ncbi:uncharacterized protein [Centruroides vittatus]|uniref:uncharacterized protein n=1 Tax=Centruroides vittatus TaxID=120091 RepID=UPI0035104A42
MDRSYYLSLEFQNIWRDVVRREKWNRLEWQMRYAPYFSNISYGFVKQPENSYRSDFLYENELNHLPVDESDNNSETIPVYQAKCSVPLKPDAKWYEIAPSADQRWTNICPQYKATKIQPEELTFNPTTEIRHKSRLDCKHETFDRKKLPNYFNYADFKYKNLMLRQPTRRYNEHNYETLPGIQNTSPHDKVLLKDDPMPHSFNRMTYAAARSRDYNLEMMRRKTIFGDSK